MQGFLKRNFSPCTPLCSYFTGIRRKRERKEEIQRRRGEKIKVWGQGSPRKKKRDHRVLVRDSLSYGINGGLMGYERMFYWKQ